MQPMDLELSVVNSIAEVSAAQWDACAGGHPFVQHAFLMALESSGIFSRERGVLPRYVLVKNANQDLVACAPAMLKWGTFREYGPERRWLGKGLQADCFAWPKFQVGVPLFPVMGPKLLVREGFSEPPLQTVLLRGLNQLAQRADQKSVFNVMHINELTARHCHSQGALVAGEWHSMWTNTGHVDITSYLASLPKRRRNQFQVDRRMANAHGLTFKVLHGHELTEELLADYYEGHRQVCERYGGKPWLPLSAYIAIVRAMPAETILMACFDGPRYVAGTLNLHARAESALYILQWSEREKLDSVAVDLLCNRPVEYALEHGIAKIDSGLTAAHKEHRGWQNTPVFHAHWFYNDELKNLAKQQLARHAGQP